MSPVFAAVIYFGVVFSAGFILGALRVLMVAPAIGPVVATLVELPLMLTVSWWAARSVVGRIRLPVSTSDLMIMGWGAFVLLQGAEVLLGLWGFGRSLADQLRAWQSPGGLLGLAGQLGFAMMPLWINKFR